MDKILSARVDEGVLNKIALLAQALHTSKKKVIESAVQLYAQKIETVNQLDVFAQTSGAWKRRETASEIVQQVRNEFRKSMYRHRP
ncbi:MAG: hypothetical protein HY591_04870 [Candidatus Omnitrophica bacterium]|nr:hypothetical protein [Candidatus Omnitrophota bacterium]